MKRPEHITQRLAELRAIVRSGQVLKRLTGETYLLERQLAIAKQLLGEALVAEAKRLGVEDATIHPQWGLYSEKAYRCRCKKPCGCMPRYDEWAGVGSGWPVVWKIAEWWECGRCGNGFNNQVDLERPFREQTR